MLAPTRPWDACAGPVPWRGDEAAAVHDCDRVYVWRLAAGCVPRQDRVQRVACDPPRARLRAGDGVPAQPLTAGGHPSGPVSRSTAAAAAGGRGGVRGGARGLWVAVRLKQTWA
eukprot:354861-Chlamydomonas_euryale.AAC.23